MKLPSIVVELLDKAKISEGDRLDFEREFSRFLQKIQEDSKKEGYSTGYNVGLEDGFDLADTIEKED